MFIIYVHDTRDAVEFILHERRPGFEIFLFPQFELSVLIVFYLVNGKHRKLEFESKSITGLVVVMREPFLKQLL